MVFRQRDKDILDSAEDTFQNRSPRPQSRSRTKKSPNHHRLGSIAVESTTKVLSEPDIESRETVATRMSMDARSSWLGSTICKNKSQSMDDKLIHPEREKATSPPVSPQWSTKSHWMSSRASTMHSENGRRRSELDNTWMSSPMRPQASPAGLDHGTYRCTISGGVSSPEYLQNARA